MDKFIGKRLDGRYEIKEIIGAGGMAYVYKAYDSIDDRVVAIKILREEYLANEEFTRRFKNESKAIAILSHPNIVKVYDVSFGERLQYIVMEYIDGITLKEYIDQQKDIKWKEAVHFTVQILRALQHAHDKGIVHRDIKPQNIMLLPDGTIKVTDFGIARFSRNEVRATSATDKAIGSVHYISPEQARGEITDEKADIYSVGVMLYEMLTGRLPFEADNAVSVAIMQLQSEPKMPREINPQIPEGLEEITIKAMQKDPAKRYQSAAEMLYDIDEFKRNPSIHFEYKYFVDETPTRFVEAITRVRGENAEEEISETQAEAETEEEEEHKGPPVLPILAAIAGAFVLVAMIFGGVALFMKFFNPKDVRENVVVPNFVGMNYEEEIRSDDSEYKDKFSFEVETVWNSEYEKGIVIDQDIPKGTSVKIKDKITLTVSKGKQMIDVPEIQPGEHKDVVRNQLTALGFVVQDAQDTSDSVAADGVINTIPAYPQQAEKGSTIIMVISVGTEPLPEEPVPDVVRAGVEDAITKISQAGFYVNRDNIVRQNHPSYPEGTVISQEPVGDSKLKKGSEVKLIISSGYKDVSVNVSLAGISTSIDLKVFIAGVEDKSLTTKFAGLLPEGLASHSVTFTAKEQKGLYQANVMISESGKNNFKPFATYEINGLDGRATLTEYTPFVSTPTTPPTASDPPTQPPTSSDPTSGSEPTDPTDNSSTTPTDEVSTAGNE